MSGNLQGLDPMEVKAKVTIAVDCLMFPDDVSAFAENWIIVKQVDETDGVTNGVYYHIRKRQEGDPDGKVMIESL